MTAPTSLEEIWQTERLFEQVEEKNDQSDQRERSTWSFTPNVQGANTAANDRAAVAFRKQEVIYLLFLILFYFKFEWHFENYTR